MEPFFGRAFGDRSFAIGCCTDTRGEFCGWQFRRQRENSTAPRIRERERERRRYRECLGTENGDREEKTYDDGLEPARGSGTHILTDEFDARARRVRCDCRGRRQRSPCGRHAGALSGEQVSVFERERRRTTAGVAADGSTECEGRGGSMGSCSGGTWLLRGGTAGGAGEEGEGGWAADETREVAEGAAETEVSDVEDETGVVMGAEEDGCGETDRLELGTATMNEVAGGADTDPATAAKSRAEAE